MILYLFQAGNVPDPVEPFKLGGLLRVFDTMLIDTHRFVLSWKSYVCSWECRTFAQDDHIGTLCNIALHQILSDHQHPSHKIVS